MKHQLIKRMGQYVEVSTSSTRAQAYVPPALPPNPPIEFDGFVPLLEQANQYLGKVSGIVSTLPDATHLILMFMRKEALLSSQIEGTQSSFNELLLFDPPKLFASTSSDVDETYRCLDALRYGFKSVDDGIPVSMRLIRGLHKRLLSSNGDFRKSQNWIGGTRLDNARYVPPPHLKVEDLMSDLERFYHKENPNLPILAKVAMVHAQFEMIHPFLDGNGRVGRVLLMIMLSTNTVLKNIVLFLSLYFKTHRNQYYECLQKVSERGDWESWIEFFLEGVVHTCKQMITTAENINRLFETHQELLARSKVPSSTIDVYKLLQKHALLTSRQAKDELDELGTKRTLPTIRDAFRRLRELDIVEYLPDRNSPRVILYPEYLTVIAEGTEPIT